MKSSPLGVCIPFSTANIPSSILNNNGNGIHTTATSNQAARAPSEVTRTDPISPRAPMSANTSAQTETRFGVSRTVTITSASLVAHVVLRCGIALRSVPSGVVGSDIRPLGRSVVRVLLQCKRCARLNPRYYPPNLELRVDVAYLVRSRGGRHLGVRRSDRLFHCA